MYPFTKTCTAENKKENVTLSHLKKKLKAIEVRQIQIITFWITLVLFLGFTLSLLIQYTNVSR